MKSYERVVENENGEEIASVIHEPEGKPKASVLLQHGLYSNKGGGWKERADYFAEKGFKAVRFDRRGYGESDRDFVDFNLTTGIEDSVNIIDFLEESGEETFTIYGSSFGGLIAIHVAARDERVGAVSLRAPVTYTEMVLADLRKEVERRGRIPLEEMPGEYIEESFFEDLKSYDIEEAAETINVPTLIFQGNDDDIVPSEGTKEFYRKLNVKKKILVYGGEGHVFSRKNDRDALEETSKWFSNYI